MQQIYGNVFVFLLLVINNRILFVWGVQRFSQSQTIVTSTFATTFSNTPLCYVSNASGNETTVILGAQANSTTITIYRTNGLQPVVYYLAIGN